MKSFKISRTGRWNPLRLGPLEIGVVDTGVTTVAVATTEMTEAEKVVDEAILEAIVIRMTGRSEERKIGHLASRTIAATVDTAITVMEIGRDVAVAVVEDVMIGLAAIETVSVKIGK